MSRVGEFLLYQDGLPVKSFQNGETIKVANGIRVTGIENGAVVFSNPKCFGSESYALVNDGIRSEEPASYCNFDPSKQPIAFGIVLFNPICFESPRDQIAMLDPQSFAVLLSTRNGIVFSFEASQPSSARINFKIVPSFRKNN